MGRKGTYSVIFIIGGLGLIAWALIGFFGLFIRWSSPGGVALMAIGVGIVGALFFAVGLLLGLIRFFKFAVKD